MKYLREIFDDRVTRAAAVVFSLIVAVVIFNLYSGIPDRYPLIGVITFGFVPLLFIAGGIIFVLAILRS